MGTLSIINNEIIKAKIKLINGPLSRFESLKVYLFSFDPKQEYLSAYTYTYYLYIK